MRERTKTVSDMVLGKRCVAMGLQSMRERTKTVSDMVRGKRCVAIELQFIRENGEMVDLITVPDRHPRLLIDCHLRKGENLRLLIDCHLRKGGGKMFKIYRTKCIWVVKSVAYFLSSIYRFLFFLLIINRQETVYQVHISRTVLFMRDRTKTVSDMVLGKRCVTMGLQFMRERTKRVSDMVLGKR